MAEKCTQQRQGLLVHKLYRNVHVFKTSTHTYDRDESLGVGTNEFFLVKRTVIMTLHAREVKMRKRELSDFLSRPSASLEFSRG